MRSIFLCRFSCRFLLCTVCLAFQIGTATAMPALTDADARTIRSTTSVRNNNAHNSGPVYGDPAGINIARNLEPDSIVVDAATGRCGTVQGTVRFLSRKGTTPVGLMSIFLDQSQSSNYTLVPSTTVQGSATVDFTLTVADPTADAFAVLVIMDRAAQRVTRSWQYTAEKVIAGPAVVEFGTLVAGTEQCRTLTLTNPTATPVELRAVEFAGGTSEFAITSLPSLPLVVLPGQSVAIEICGRATGDGEFQDSIRVRLSCYSTVAAAVKMQTAIVRVEATDHDFGDVSVDSERSQEIVVENISNGEVPVELYSVDWDDKEHFRTEGLESDKFPIVLPKPGDTYTFTVYYTPTGAGGRDSTVARFTGNTSLDKPYSVWMGTGLPLVSVHEWETARLQTFPVVPQPLAGTGSVRYTLDSPASVVLSVYTMLGERVLVADKGMQSAGEHTMPVDSAHLLPGLYLFRIDAGGRSAVQTVLVRE